MADDPEDILTETTPTYRSYRFVMAALVLAGHLSVGLNVFAVSPLLPLAIDDYNVNRAAAGLLVALPLLVAAALGLPSGILIARIGLRRAFIIGWSAVALVSLSGAAPNFITLLLLSLSLVWESPSSSRLPVPCCCSGSGLKK